MEFKGPKYTLNDDDDVDNEYQPLDNQPIHAPQPPPQPAQLEELQTVVRQRRPPRLLSSICEVQLALTSVVRCVSQPALLAIGQNASHRLGLAPPSSSSANGSLAPRDIDNSISSANINSSPRERKQTPASHSTHHVSLAEDSQTDSLIDVDVACNLEVSEAVIGDIQDTAYDEPLCFFTRTLRIPQKEIHLQPDVVAARKKEIQGLFKSGCFRWVSRANAYPDNIKPIHTGFVDAVKIDEATGSQKFKSRLVMFGRLTPRYVKTTENRADVFTKALPAPAHRTFTDQITVPLDAHMAEDEDAPARLFRSDSISPSLSPYVVRARKRKGKKLKKAE
eukprot:g3866.t1